MCATSKSGCPIVVLPRSSSPSLCASSAVLNRLLRRVTRAEGRGCTGEDEASLPGGGNTKRRVPCPCVGVSVVPSALGSCASPLGRAINLCPCPGVGGVIRLEGTRVVVGAMTTCSPWPGEAEEELLVDTAALAGEAGTSETWEWPITMLDILESVVEEGSW